MIEVCLVDHDASSIFNIVHELKIQGLVIDKDFSFHYHPPKWDNFSGDAVHNKRTVFSFKEGSVASWFALKYGNQV